jgi:hypothetical protein
LSQPTVPITDPQNLDLAWDRAGARTVAGVTYQVAVTAHLLIVGRAQDLPIVEVVPEGAEDIDCKLSDGSHLFVQAKERARGESYLTKSHVAGVIDHAASVMRKDSTSRIVLVTDAGLASGLTFTGWEETVASHLSATTLEELAKSISSTSPSAARALLERSHIVQFSWDIGAQSVIRLAETFEMTPAVAGLVHAYVLKDIANVASDQRFRSKSNAIARRVSDLDAIVRRVLETVDVEHLDVAIRAGIVEPLNFTVAEAISPDRFLAGVNVNPTHIAANLDLPRPRELDAIYSGLRDDRYLLIVGPSGSGKSALVWRAARDVVGFVRPVRILRLQRQDVPPLLRWVRMQEPSPETPVLVCADDLGRPHMAGWSIAVDQMLEIPGVIILGAARQEDFHPGMVRSGATIIEPQLDLSLAQAIATTLTSRQFPIALDPTEAFDNSGRLLMEFLSLLVSGRRLEEIVTAQVYERFAPDRRTEREVLRYVCAAHMVGLSLSANALPVLTNQASDLTSALARLRKEHIITSDDRHRWIGLHELRSEVITRRLHELPPPTEGTTFSDLISNVDPKERKHLIVRYAMMPSAELWGMAEVVAELLKSGTLDAAGASDLVEALGQADATRYAIICLSAAANIDNVPVDLYSKVFLAYSTRYLGVDIPGLLPAIKSLAQRLPERPPSLRERGVRDFPSAAITALVATANTSDALRLLESLEEAASITASDAGAIWDVHCRAPITHRSRLIATLARVADISAGAGESCFAPLVIRIHDLVNEHPNGIKGWKTVDAEDGIVVTIQLMSPSQGEDPHKQTVDCARMILDLCPEADIAEVITIGPDGEPCRYGDLELFYKRIPRANFRRAADTKPNADFLNAVMRLMATRYWTDRLSQQADVSKEIVSLLKDVAVRLMNRYDNSRRRQEWIRRIVAVRKTLATLPPPPVPDIDRTTPDPAKDGLNILSTALEQLAAQLDVPETHRLRGIASQIRQALIKLAEARAAGYPKFSSIGDPLPEALDSHARATADLLLAFAEEDPELRLHKRRRDQQWQDVAVEVVRARREQTLVGERKALEAVFKQAGVNATTKLVAHLDANNPQLVTDRWIVLLPIEDWKQVALLLELPEHQRRCLAFRTFALPTQDGFIIPIHCAQLGTETLHPLMDQADISARIQDTKLPCLVSPLIETVNRLIAVLSEASRNASITHLRSPEFQCDEQYKARATALEEAKRLVGLIDEDEISHRCFQLVAGVENEFKGDHPGLAGALFTALRTGVITEPLIAAKEIVYLASEAAISKTRR